MNIILKTFSWVSWRVVVFLCFIHSDIFYCLSCSCMWAIILCLHVILARFVHRLFHFIAVPWSFSFCQQNYLYQSVIIILSWNHDHQFQFMIQIQVMNLVHISHRKASYWLIHFLYCLQKILSKRIIFFSHLEDMSSIFINTAS